MSVLKGYRVLDCSIAMAGPFAAQRLGDLGADVIKVEPVAGEWQRFKAAGGATGNRINVSFLSLNRNKRSLAVDLKAPGAIALTVTPYSPNSRAHARVKPTNAAFDATYGESRAQPP